MKLVVVPLALAELHDVATFYAARANAELGLSFIAEFERTANGESNPNKSHDWRDLSW